MLIISFLILISSSLSLADEERRDALAIPILNCLDEFHFCFGAKNNDTSVSKNNGCLRDSDCDIVLLADATDASRVRWNLHLKHSYSSNMTVKPVAYFFLTKQDVCSDCDFEPGLHAHFNIPSDELIVEYRPSDLNMKPDPKQYVIRGKKGAQNETEGHKIKSRGGTRFIKEYRTGGFEFKDSLAETGPYKGIIFTSSQILTYDEASIDVFNDWLQLHLILANMHHESDNSTQIPSGSPKPNRIEVITNVSLKKMLLFSEKDVDTNYQRDVRKWTIINIVMLALLCIITFACCCYYRSQMRIRASPDNINDLFDS